ncbi:Retrovirus-related Pol polyprotein from transposon RE2 [Sesamum angolense]|uniref:Retrovirus-related Pol polyprotein from transposon RE2 n=1 Tax=Sesamum angolense TaxID=2727404 RepID=A0AAE2BLK4_9LAMI|nr:Retrovirus-related Pol polyprotein from transposon RE2 [Sesamum angolense]
MANLDSACVALKGDSLKLNMVKGEVEMVEKDTISPSCKQIVKRALRAKMKLGFIDGTTTKPHSTDQFFEQWIRVDGMVMTWILNCISKEIVGSFMYAKSGRTLWLDLEERYGECNGPLLYQLQREATFTKLIQFLTGLGETFHHLHDQLLVMDPVQTVNKAYSMVLLVEKQREVNVDCTNTMDNAAMQVRLGHPSLSVLKYVPDVKSIDTSVTCMVCPLAKQSRLPFSTCEIHSKNPFELIHVDLWGPYKTPTLDGCNYFLTIVDDFSRATWTFLLRYKTQVCHTLETFFKMILTQFESKIKVLRSDNGTEFTNTHCQSLFQSLGILHHRSCPHTPQQNSVVERKHRHILNVARALKFQANLQSKYWGESIHATTYLINTAHINSTMEIDKLPYNHHKPPFYANLKVFGCLYFASNTSPSKQKCDARAHKCVFLGCSQTHKAYKVVNLDTNLSFYSREVNFHEDIFPFHSVSTSGVPKSASLLPLYSADSDDDITPPTMPSSTPAINPTVTSAPEPPTATDTISNSPEFPFTSLSVPVYVPPPRRSLRTVQKPAWLDDYVCQCASNSNHTCLLSTYTSTHMSFVALLSFIQEPGSYLEASKDVRWVNAMNEELTALDKNETWELASLPRERKSLAVMAKGWPLWQLDVNNAFLHEHLNEEVYMEMVPSCPIQPLIADSWGFLSTLVSLDPISRLQSNSLTHSSNTPGPLIGMLLCMFYAASEALPRWVFFLLL